MLQVSRRTALTPLLVGLAFACLSPTAPGATHQPEAAPMLDRQRERYERALERIRKSINSQLESKRRRIARMSGATDETNTLLAEMQAFESEGKIPDVPAADSLRRAYAKAATAMTDAYNEARLTPDGAELFTQEADHFASHWDLAPWQDLALPSGDEPTRLKPDQPISLTHEISGAYRLEVLAEAVDDDATLAVEFPLLDGARLALPSSPDNRGDFHIIITVDEDLVAADLGVARPIDLSSAYGSDKSNIELFARDGSVEITSVRMKSIIEGEPPDVQVAQNNGNKRGEGREDANPLPKGSEWTGTLFGRSAGARVATVKVISSNEDSAVLSVIDKFGENHWQLRRDGENFIVTSILPKKDRRATQFKNIRGTGRVADGRLRWDGRWVWQNSRGAAVDAYLDIQMK